MWSLQNVLPYADCKLPVIYATLHKVAARTTQVKKLQYLCLRI
jgi:hypothetical protein